MSFLEEHNYCGSVTKIKTEIDKNALQVPEINIKSEFESDDCGLAQNEATCSHNGNNSSYCKTENSKTKTTKNLKNIKTENNDKNDNADNCSQTPSSPQVTVNVIPENTTETAPSFSRNENEGMFPSSEDISDLKKACILQTCISLLDSSSSDDDELLLLWLLCRNRRRLRKRRKV